jgi:uncharacterized protein with von Willebrand factor type A (vWA) domain
MGTNWYFMAHTRYRPIIHAKLRSAQAFVQMAAVAIYSFDGGTDIVATAASAASSAIRALAASASLRNWVL